MPQPDLFVVCKNCGSEVSPYVTECPYCGQRVRKRAPKIDRGDEGAETRKRRRPALSRLRPDEIEGIAPDRRPYATILLMTVSLLATVVVQAGVDSGDIGRILIGFDDDVWRWFAAPFVYDTSLGYEFVALMAAGVFGTLLERRYGPMAVIAIFVLGGAAGCALAVQLDAPALLSSPIFTPVLGANGAALALLVAWLVDDRVAARRGEERSNDMLGVAVFAAVLVLLSVAVEEANIAAAAGGAVAGALLGAALPIFNRRPATY
jgi:membrane associated rhomboid family serine protease